MSRNEFLVEYKAKYFSIDLHFLDSWTEIKINSIAMGTDFSHTQKFE